MFVTFPKVSLLFLASLTSSKENLPPRQPHKNIRRLFEVTQPASRPTRRKPNKTLSVWAMKEGVGTKDRLFELGDSKLVSTGPRCTKVVCTGAVANFKNTISR